jgi:16S rRNA (guanine527-N7)-methyltransferase
VNLRAWTPTVASSSVLPEVTLSTPDWLTDPQIESSLRAFSDILASTGVERGLIGPREVDRLWDRHILNCAVVTDAVPRGTHVIDIGSGAGLPGMVWAIVRPDITVTCLEPLLRRATFLSEAVEALGLDDRVFVPRGRAEEQRGRVSAPVTTARAVAPLGRLAGWALPLTEPGGALLALKGASAEEEITAAADELAALGVEDVTIEEFGRGIVDPPTRVIRVPQARRSQ